MKFKSKVILMCLAMVGVWGLTGCSLQTKIGSAANTLVANYCTKPAEERALVRLWIDQATTPNQIRVKCASDAEVIPTDPVFN